MCRNTFGELIYFFNFKAISTKAYIPIFTMVNFSHTMKTKQAFYELKHFNHPIQKKAHTKNRVGKPRTPDRVLEALASF